MSDVFKPADYGLPDVRVVRFKKPRLCRLCGDEFLYYRWGGNNYCPDCDIKRMKRISDSLDAIQNAYERAKPAESVDERGENG
jgi:hypothetical protein